MAVYKYLDVSTRFITAIDNDLLSREAMGHTEVAVLSVDAFRGGYWLFANLYDGVTRDDLLTAGYSENLIQIMEQAYTEDCQWIKLDCDGDEEAFDDLPKFEW